MTPETKDIKNYIHLYLGCECRCFHNNSATSCTLTPELLIDIEYEDSGLDGIMLCLRRLDSMTVHEKGEIFDLMGWADFTHPTPISSFIRTSSRVINWLRQREFDVDELIDAGLAIEKK